jgi:ankyrin repeat protein
VRPRRNSAAATGICRRLLAAGADVGDRDQDESGMTPLHHAAEWGHEVCLHLVDLLLAAGAELNGTDVEGWTALDYARDRGRSAMQSHLLDLGAISHR